MLGRSELALFSPLPRFACAKKHFIPSRVVASKLGERGAAAARFFNEARWALAYLFRAVLARLVAVGFCEAPCPAAAGAVSMGEGSDGLFVSLNALG